MPPKRTAAEPLATSGPTMRTEPRSSNPAVEVDLSGALYQAVIAGLFAFYDANATFQMPYGVYTRDELIAEFQEFVASPRAGRCDEDRVSHVRELQRGLAAEEDEVRVDRVGE
jgi:hypothetical protein